MLPIAYSGIYLQFTHTASRNDWCIFDNEKSPIIIPLAGFSAQVSKWFLYGPYLTTTKRGSTPGHGRSCKAFLIWLMRSQSVTLFFAFVLDRQSSSVLVTQSIGISHLSHFLDHAIQVVTRPLVRQSTKSTNEF